MMLLIWNLKLERKFEKNYKLVKNKLIKLNGINFINTYYFSQCYIKFTKTRIGYKSSVFLCWTIYILLRAFFLNDGCLKNCNYNLAKPFIEP